MIRSTSHRGRLFYSDEFVLPLPSGHRFPMAKYRQLRERLLDSGVVSHTDLEVPAAATDDQLRLAHTDEYIQRVTEGLLTSSEIRRIGFPWSPQLVERSRRSVGATIAACAAALDYGVGVNLAGGTHHAFTDRGEGYCVFNDVAVAIRVHQREQRAQRVVVVDCDVHQGNGTAAIFRGDPSVFTFSMHGRRNFLFRKEAGDLDVALDDAVADVEYLDALERALADGPAHHAADLAVYVSGADPFAGDRLGRLALSKEGLARRDRYVLDWCRDRGVPVAVVMAGGYSTEMADIVDIHCATVALALEGTPVPRL